jgi:3-oxoadipate enol-lactonase
MPWSDRGTTLQLHDGVSTFAAVGGHTLHVRRDGPAGAPSGDPVAARIPVLVHLHSLGTELRIWDGVVARLPGYAHLRVDLRGHGLSDVPAGDYTIAAMAEDVLALLDLAGLRRVVLAGVSVGGQVALQVALERPELVAGLVLLATAARIGEARAWDERIATVRQEGLAAIADAVVARWFAPSFDAREPAARLGYRNLLLRTSAAGYTATCAALRDADLTDRLQTIAQPALVMCGSRDEATPPALVRGLAAALPRGRYTEIDVAGHLPCIDRAGVTAHHVDGFVREVAAV